MSLLLLSLQLFAHVSLLLDMLVLLMLLVLKMEPLPYLVRAVAGLRDGVHGPRGGRQLGLRYVVLIAGALAHGCRGRSVGVGQGVPHRMPTALARHPHHLVMAGGAAASHSPRESLDLDKWRRLEISSRSNSSIHAHHRLPLGSHTGLYEVLRSPDAVPRGSLTESACFGATDVW